MLKYRKAVREDVDLYYLWANDKKVRSQSFVSDQITYQDHVSWFERKLLDQNSVLLVFENEEGIPVGQIRFQNDENGEYIIGISVAAENRGKGYAIPMLKMSAGYFFEKQVGEKIIALIKEENIKSKSSFEKAGYVFECNMEVNGNKSYRYVKHKND